MDRTLVLSIEDDQSDIALMTYILKEIRPSVVTKFIRDGQSALSYLRHPNFKANPPKIILMDIKLPRISGLELLKKYRAEKDIPQVPVVMLSSSDRNDEIAQSYSNGANSYVPKPRDLNELREKLTVIMEYWLEVNKN